MSGRLHDGLTALRRRRLAIALALAAAPLLALLWLAAYRFGQTAAAAVAAAAVLALLLWRHDERRRIDVHRFARALNAADPRLDDSAELLLADARTLAPLAQLQQQRLRTRIAEHLPDLRPAWPQRGLLVSLLLGAIIVLASLWQPPAASVAAAAADASASAAEPVRWQGRLDIVPPRYTGLEPTQSATLDARVPAGAVLRWQLGFVPAPRAARLRLHDGRILELVRDGEYWRGELVLDSAALYRIEIDADTPLAEDGRHRLELIGDSPPQIRVDAPDKTLSLRESGHDHWDFDIRASDDYGLGDATLEITQAQGSGENIAVKQHSLALRGEGDRRERRYRQRIDLAALALTAGDEVIVRFDVSDRREPQPQRSRSASYILRLPPPPGDDSVGMDGLMRQALPAYFRSQRQLIIDTEALIAERAKLGAERFAARSDALGVEQKILRLRYGQFLGEEFESGGRGGAAHANEGTAGAGEHHDAHADADAEAGAEAPPRRFGDAGNVLAEFGHTHDHTEAATLLDPDTKRILKVALEAMWQSELELRSGRPVQALPHEYKALEQIKLVQQATRIYLARVGLELPPVDETRRLSGDRAGLRDASNAAVAATAADADLEAIWQALASAAAPDWARWEAWQRRRGRDVPDALDLAAAADGLRRDPACAACAVELRERLWPLLPPSAAASAGRATPDTAGRAYLDALQAAEGRP